MSTLYIAGDCFSGSLWNRLGLYNNDPLFTIAILLQDRVRFTAQPTTSPLWYLAEEVGNYFLADERYKIRFTTHLLDAIDPSIILPIFTKEGMRPFAMREILTSSIDRTGRPGTIVLAANRQQKDRSYSQRQLGQHIALTLARIKLLIDFESSIELDYKSWEGICRARGFFLTCVYHTCEFWEQNLRDVVTSLNIARTCFRRKFVDTSLRYHWLFYRPLVQLDYPEATFEADCDLCKMFYQYSFDES